MKEYHDGQRVEKDAQNNPDVSTESPRPAPEQLMECDGCNHFVPRDEIETVRREYSNGTIDEASLCEKCRGGE